VATLQGTVMRERRVRERLGTIMEFLLGSPVETSPGLCK